MVVASDVWVVGVAGLVVGGVDRTRLAASGEGREVATKATPARRSDPQATHNSCSRRFALLVRAGVIVGLIEMSTTGSSALSDRQRTREGR